MPHVTPLEERRTDVRARLPTKPDRPSLLRQNAGLSTMEYAVLFVMILVGVIGLWSTLGRDLAVNVEEGHNTVLEAMGGKTRDTGRGNPGDTGAGNPKDPPPAAKRPTPGREAPRVKRKTPIQ